MAFDLTEVLISSRDRSTPPGVTIFGLSHRSGPFGAQAYIGFPEGSTPKKGVPWTSTICRLNTMFNR